MKGLILYPPPPNSRRYFLLEKAISHNPKSLGEVDVGEFYKYVGLSNQQQQLGGVKPAQKPPKKRSQDTVETTTQVAKKSRKDIAHEATVNIQVDRLRDLFVRRCKNCSMCIKPTCKNCSACKRNSSAMGQRIACYQKVSWHVHLWLLKRAHSCNFTGAYSIAPLSRCRCAFNYLLMRRRKMPLDCPVDGNFSILTLNMLRGIHLLITLG